MESQNTVVKMGGAETDGTGPIFLLARDCDDLFQKIRGNEKVPHSLKRHLDEYSDRFDSWASFLGVSAGQTTSLAYRLRRHRDFQDMIARLLDILRRNLFVLSQSVDTSWPIESSRQVHINVASHYGASGEVGDHVVLDEAPSERNAAVSGIAESISRLNKLVITIRQSSRSTATARARRFATQYLDLDAFDETAYDALEILYPNAPETLRQQLCNAMTDRYVKHQYEAYRLGKHSIQYPSKVVQNDAQDKATQLEDNIQPSEIRPGGEGHIPNPASDQPAHRPDAVYQFGAPTIDTQLLHRNVAAAVTSPSRPPRTLSVFDENDRQNEPPPPKFENGKDRTDCEWCFQLIDQSLVDGSGWSDAGRRHYRKDLQPFVCISEQCADSRPGYPSRTEWFDHMKTHSLAWSQKVHRQPMWRCDYNHDKNTVYMFSDPNNLYNHITLHHEHQVVRPNVAEVWERVAAAAVDDTRPADVCPLCFLIVVRADPEPRKRRQSQDEGSEKRLKSTAKRSKATFAEDVSGPDEPLNEETKGPVLEETADEAETDGLQATSYALGLHIAAHLQYLMFLSLRLMVTHNETKDDEDDVRRFSLAPESGASQSEERRAEAWGDASHEGHNEISLPRGRGTNPETKKSAPAEGDGEEEISEVVLSDDIRYPPDTAPSEDDNWKRVWEWISMLRHEELDENALVSFLHHLDQGDETGFFSSFEETQFLMNSPQSEAEKELDENALVSFQYHPDQGDETSSFSSLEEMQFPMNSPQSEAENSVGPVHSHFQNYHHGPILENYQDYSKSPVGAKPAKTIVEKTPAHSTKKDVAGGKRVGRRRGPLTPDQRQQAREIRKLRACLSCKFLKKTCDKSDPCGRCQLSHVRLWQVPCTRIDVKDIAYFMKDWKADYERHVSLGFSIGNIKGFSAHERPVYITHGYGHYLPIMAREVYVRDEKCFGVDWVETLHGIHFEMNTAKLSAGIEGISQSLLSDYLDRHIDGGFEQFVDKYFEGTYFVTEILKTAHRFYCRERLHVIRKALKLVLAYNFTLHITMVEGLGESESNIGKIEDNQSKFCGKTIAPVMINFQVKCALADMWRELQKDVLEELSALYSSVYSGDKLKNWPTIFMLAAILLTVWELIQFDCSYRVPDQAAVNKFCADMEGTPVGVIVGLFSVISQELPAFTEWDTRKHHHVLNSNPAVCDAMTEVRAHVTKYESYLRSRSDCKFDRSDFESLSSKFLSKLVIRDN